MGVEIAHDWLPQGMGREVLNVHRGVGAEWALPLLLSQRGDTILQTG